MKRIYIADDFTDPNSPDAKIAKRWQSHIQEFMGSDYDVVLLSPDEIEQELDRLGKRRQAHRDGHDIYEIPVALDDAAMLVIDYDLTYLQKRPDTSGEIIAYLARCFSKCGLIVGVNRYTDVGVFDLRMAPPLGSYADFNVHGDYLADRGFWSDDAAGSTPFRPWPWPNIGQEILAFDTRVDQVRGKLEDGDDREPIVDFFGFPKRQKENLPRTLCDFLEPTDKPYYETAFADFVKPSSRSIGGKDSIREFPIELRSRIAAARLQAWLERVVLPRQDILVDAPHLVSEFPSLLLDSQDQSSWNASARLRSPEMHLAQVVDHVWKKDGWLSRIAWWGDEVRQDTRIAEVRNPFASSGLDLVFAEDTSRFIPRGEARAFLNATGSSDNVRYVMQVGNLDYQPAIQFAKA